MLKVGKKVSFGNFWNTKPVEDGGSSEGDDLDFFGMNDSQNQNDGQNSDQNNQENDQNANSNSSGSNQGDGNANDDSKSRKREPSDQNKIGEVQRKISKEIKALQAQMANLSKSGTDPEKLAELQKKYGNYKPEDIETVKKIALEATADLRNQNDVQKLNTDLQNYFTVNNVPTEARQAINNAVNYAENAPQIRRAISEGAISLDEVRMVFDYPRVVKAFKDQKVKYENLLNQFSLITKGSGTGADLPEGAPDFSKMSSDEFAKWKKENVRV